jgi:hypothetical protein
LLLDHLAQGIGRRPMAAARVEEDEIHLHS